MGDLADHNDRDWFQSNKARYERDVKQPALDFIRGFAPLLSDVSPHFLAVPKAQGGSLFRIYRDTRFSKDKTPYKTHTALQFRHEASSRDVHAPGFYLGLEPGASMLGAGAWTPPAPALKRIREHIVAEADAWADVRHAIEAEGLSFMGDDMLKRAPKGFDPDHRHIEDLRRKSFAVRRDLSDAEVCAPGFDQALAAHYQAASPLLQFLCEALELPF
jgi:uncharacterized protein (TIGR02453 family)